MQGVNGSGTGSIPGLGSSCHAIIPCAVNLPCTRKAGKQRHIPNGPIPRDFSFGKRLSLLQLEPAQAEMVSCFRRSRRRSAASEDKNSTVKLLLAECQHQLKIILPANVRTFYFVRKLRFSMFMCMINSSLFSIFRLSKFENCKFTKFETPEVLWHSEDISI